jgi:hypothetical protein
LFLEHVIRIVDLGRQPCLCLVPYDFWGTSQHPDERNTVVDNRRPIAIVCTDFSKASKLVFKKACLSNK